MVTAACTIVKKAPSRSIQGRVGRAILNKGLSKHALAKLVDVKGVRIRGNSTTLAYNDFNLMAEGKLLSKKKRNVARFDFTKMKKAVHFILSPGITGTLSWGTKTVKLCNTESVEQSRDGRVALAMERPVVQPICILFGRRLLNCSTQVLSTSR